jgi:DNA-binding MarR family transcriptional regulator
MRAPDYPHDFAACALAWQTLRLAHERVSERLGSDLARGCSLAINEFDVLLYLHTHRSEAVRISALLGAVSLSQPALSRLVARLEERGLLARCPSEDDGRAADISLTPAGDALIERAIEVHAHAVHETLTSKLTDAEQQALLQALNRIGGDDPHPQPPLP